MEKIHTYDKILSPIVRGRKGAFRELLLSIYREGFMRARIDNNIITLTENIELQKTKKHTIEILIDRLVIQPNIQDRLTESIELALKIGKGLVIIEQLGIKDKRFFKAISRTKT